jgi:hypothetical protein
MGAGIRGVEVVRHITFGELLQLLAVIMSLIAALTIGAEWKATITTQVRVQTQATDKLIQQNEQLEEKVGSMDRRLSRVEGTLRSLR